MIEAPALVDRLIKLYGIDPEENETLGKTQVEICVDNCLYE